MAAKTPARSAAAKKAAATRKRNADAKTKAAAARKRKAAATRKRNAAPAAPTRRRRRVVRKKNPVKTLLPQLAGHAAGTGAAVFAGDAIAEAAAKRDQEKVAADAWGAMTTEQQQEKLSFVAKTPGFIPAIAGLGLALVAEAKVKSPTARAALNGAALGLSAPLQVDLARGLRRKMQEKKAEATPAPSAASPAVVAQRRAEMRQRLADYQARSVAQPRLTSPVTQQRPLIPAANFARF